MAVYKKLKDFLDKNRVKFEANRHKEVYTAQEIAAVQHVPGDNMAKVVIVKADGKLGMLVLPATHKIDFKKLQSVLKVKNIKLASEAEFKSAFPDCEVGAMPPFGSLYNIPLLADKALTGSSMIAFNAGTHKDSVAIRLSDFTKLEKPVMVDFSVHI